MSLTLSFISVETFSIEISKYRRGSSFRILSELAKGIIVRHVAY